MSKAQQTRESIINAAQDLFIRKGYDQTSIEDIMRLTGISKGGLYYHFKSKEEIMDAMLLTLINPGIEEAKKVVAMKDKPIIERLMCLFGAMHVEAASSEVLLDQLHQSQNALLHQKTLSLSTQLFVPLLADLIEKGTHEGIFHTDYPRESAMALFASAQLLFDEQFFPMTPTQQVTTIKAFLCMAERTVGAPKGFADPLINVFIH